MSREVGSAPMSDELSYTVEALQNHGVPIRLRVLDTEGKPSYGPDGPVWETVHLRFTAASMMKIEAHYRNTTATEMVDEVVFKNQFRRDGDSTSVIPIKVPTGKHVPADRVLHGIDAFNYMASTSPTETIITVLAFAFDTDVATMARRVDVADVGTLINAAEVAFKMAQGLPPTVAVATLKQLAAAAAANADLQDHIQTRAAEVLETQTEQVRAKLASLHGESGSPSGPSLDEQSTSS